MPLVKSGAQTEPPISVQMEEAQKAAPSVVQVALSKDERISRQGVWQALYHSAFLSQLATSLDDYRRLIDEEADRVLGKVNKQ